MDVLIAMGLPASGKTTFLMNEYHKLESKFTKYLSIDKLSEKEIKKTIMNINKKCDNLIIDGLFLKNNDISKVLNLITESVNEPLNVILYHFEENRAKCLHNDLGRRKEDSTITIINALYEKVDKLEILDGLTIGAYNNVKDIKVIELKIQKKKKYQIFAEANNCDKKICSDRWATGGNYCDCWGNDTEVTPEGPYEFEKLKEILEKNCKGLTQEQYKEIFDSCVYIDYDEDHDYYGGCVEYEMYVCDIETLFDKLKEMNLLEIDNLGIEDR